MLDEEADEGLARAQRRAVEVPRRLVRVVAVAIDQAETLGRGEIKLLGRQRESPAGQVPAWIPPPRSSVLNRKAIRS